MYSILLLAAMTGGQAAGLGDLEPWWGHEGPAPVLHPLGGVVIFFWYGPIDISPAEWQAWKEYIDALDEPDKSDAMDLWCKADCHGRKLLLGQVSLMRPKKEGEEKKDDPKKNDKKDTSAGSPRSKAHPVAHVPGSRARGAAPSGR